MHDRRERDPPLDASARVRRRPRGRRPPATGRRRSWTTGSRVARPVPRRGRSFGRRTRGRAVRFSRRSISPWRMTSSRAIASATSAENSATFCADHAGRGFGDDASCPSMRRPIRRPGGRRGRRPRWRPAIARPTATRGTPRRSPAAGVRPRRALRVGFRRPVAAAVSRSASFDSPPARSRLRPSDCRHAGQPGVHEVECVVRGVERRRDEPVHPPLSIQTPATPARHRSNPRIDSSDGRRGPPIGEGGSWFISRCGRFYRRRMVSGYTRRIRPESWSRGNHHRTLQCPTTPPRYTTPPPSSRPRSASGPPRCCSPPSSSASSRTSATGGCTGAELGARARAAPARHRATSSTRSSRWGSSTATATGRTATYFNTPAGSLYLDRTSPRYVGGILEMLNARLFKFWHDLPEALRTGKPQNEVKHSQKAMFEELYADLPRLEQFMGAMTGLSRINFEAFAEKFDFSPFKTLCDVGGATGLLCDRSRQAASAPAAARRSTCRRSSRSRRSASRPPGCAGSRAPRRPATSSRIRCPRPT